MTSRGTAERKLQTPPNLEPVSSLENATGAYSKQNMRSLDYTHCSTLYKDKIPVTHDWYNFHSHSLRDLILVQILANSFWPHRNTPLRRSRVTTRWTTKVSGSPDSRVNVFKFAGKSLKFGLGTS